MGTDAHNDNRIVENERSYVNQVIAEGLDMDCVRCEANPD